MAMVEDWFWQFIPELMGLVPRSDWPPLNDPWWLGVMAVFKRNGVTEDSAREIAMAMMEVPFGPLDRFIESCKAQNAAYWNRKRVAESTVPPRLLESPSDECRQVSLDCPECKGGGMAFRYLILRALPDRCFRVELFCRCLMGRWRKDHDGDLFIGEKIRCKDDLQARPELWNESLDHPHWDSWPCEHDLGLGDLQQYFRYALPGEKLPKIQDKMIANALARKNRQAAQTQFRKVD